MAWFPFPFPEFSNMWWFSSILLCKNICTTYYFLTILWQLGWLVEKTPAIWQKISSAVHVIDFVRFNRKRKFKEKCWKCRAFCKLLITYFSFLWNYADTVCDHVNFPNFSIWTYVILTALRWQSVCANQCNFCISVRFCSEIDKIPPR